MSAGIDAVRDFAPDFPDDITVVSDLSFMSHINDDSIPTKEATFSKRGNNIPCPLRTMTCLLFRYHRR